MKKKNLIILGIGIAFLFTTLKVEAATNPYKPQSSFGVNCTWYAWDQVYNKLGIALPGWGNADTWFDYAKKAGFEVGMTPRNKSIAVWKWSSYGHVAYVERTTGDKIYIWDSAGPCIDYEDPELKECIKNGVSEETDRACVEKYGKKVGCEYPATYWSEPGDLIGYIYLDKIPTQVTNPSSNKNTTPKKSNNANLETLTLTNIDFSFSKEKDKYEIVVENNINKTTVNATSQHKAAKIEGLGEYNLNIGVNTLNIVVTAEDGTKKTYTIEIKRKDNNAYLKELTIWNVDFVFDKEILEYEVNVPNEVDNIKIEGLAESELAKIEGLKEYELQEGINTIQIKIIAEDETEKVYTININREANQKKSEHTKKENHFLIYSLIGGGILFITTGCVFVLRIRKRNKSKK